MRKPFSDTEKSCIIFIILMSFITLLFAIPSIVSVIQFHYAVDLLQDGEYEKAKHIFDEIPPDQGFLVSDDEWYKKCSKREQNAIYLSEYAYARACGAKGDFETADRILCVAHYFYGDYHGPLADELEAYKKEVQSAVKAAEAETE